MVKKSKSSNKSKQKSSLTKQARQRRMIFRVIFGVLLLVGLFYAYRAYVIHRDVALLDQAEVKMRTIKPPPGGAVTYTRSCSVRSVKYGSPGNPNCGVALTVEYTGDVSQSTHEEIYKSLEQTIESLGSHLEKDGVTGGYAYYSVVGFNDELSCSLSINNMPVSGSGYVNMDNSFHLYCQKKFMKQVYPEQ